MQLDDFKILCFECYGTLIDRRSGIHTALHQLLAKGHITLSRDAVLQAFAQHEEVQRAKTPQLSYAEILAGAHRQLAKAWGVVASEDDHLLFGRSVGSWPAFADAPAALQYLDRYYKLVVLTEADRDSFLISKRQLPVRFEAVFTREDCAARKPDPACFEHMLMQLAVDRRQILHTAENPLLDLAPAAASGLATARINRQPKSAENAGAIAAPYEFEFASMVDMVRAHQEQLVA